MKEGGSGTIRELHHSEGNVLGKQNTFKSVNLNVRFTDYLQLMSSILNLEGCHVTNVLCPIHHRLSAPYLWKNLHERLPQTDDIFHQRSLSSWPCPLFTANIQPDVLRPVVPHHQPLSYNHHVLELTCTAQIWWNWWNTKSSLALLWTCYLVVLCVFFCTWSLHYLVEFICNLFIVCCLSLCAWDAAACNIFILHVWWSKDTKTIKLT